MAVEAAKDAAAAVGVTAAIVSNATDECTRRAAVPATFRVGARGSGAKEP